MKRRYAYLGLAKPSRADYQLHSDGYVQRQPDGSWRLHIKRYDGPPIGAWDWETAAGLSRSKLCSTQVWLLSPLMDDVATFMLGDHPIRVHGSKIYN